MNVLSFVGPAIWNRILDVLKRKENVNTIKHKIKDLTLNDLTYASL